MCFLCVLKLDTLDLDLLNIRGEKTCHRSNTQSLPSESSVTLVRHQFTSNFIRNVKFYYGHGILIVLFCLEIMQAFTRGSLQIPVSLTQMISDSTDNTFRGVNSIRGEQTLTIAAQLWQIFTLYHKY